MIPLLGNNELVSPTMMGVLTSKTADLLVNQGQTLANTIEKQSLTAEAQAKAPAITDLYSSAYQKIASGDFTGFADMQKARAMGIGNPILMKTLDDADMIAGHLANEWMATDRFNRKEAFDKDKEDFQLKKQGELQNSIDDRADRRNQDMLDRTELQSNTAIYKQQHADWEKENYLGQKQYEADYRTWQKQQEAANRKAELLGTEPQQIPQPEKFTPRPEPKIEDFTKTIAPKIPTARGSKAAAALPSQLGPDLDLPLPTGDSASDAPSLYDKIGDDPDWKTANDAFQAAQQAARKYGNHPPADLDGNHPPADLVQKMDVAGKQMDVIAKKYQDAEQNSIPKAPTSPAAAPSANNVPSGDLIPGINEDSASLIPGLDDTGTTRTKSVPHKTGMPIRSSSLEEQASKPVPEQMGAKVAEGKPLEKIVFGYNNGLGMIVNIHPPGPKLESFKADVSAGKVDETYKLSHEEEEARDLVSHFSSDENFAKWVAYQGRMGHQITFKKVNDGKGKDGLDYIARTGDSEYQKQTLVNGTPTFVTERFTKDDADKWDKMRGLMANHVITTEHPPLDDESKQAFRQQAIQVAAQTTDHTPDYNDANRQLKKLGVDPIGPEDVDKFRQGVQSMVSAVASKQKDESLDKQAEAELKSQGFTLPSQMKQDTDAAAQLANSKQRVQDAPKEIEALQKQLEDLRKSSGGTLTAAQLEQAKAIQKKIIQTKQDLEFHSTKVSDARLGVGSALGM